MVISKKLNFIFIKTRKTAGTTIEILLRGVLGTDVDVVDGKILRNGTTGEAVVTDGQDENLAGHMSAEEIAAVVGRSFWSSAFKFTAERHPYEKAVSMAYYNFGRRIGRGRTTPASFSKFLDRTVEKGKYRSFDQYSINGSVVVDDVIRHESLHADLTRIGGRLGFEVPSELPMKKTAYREDRRLAREILSEDQRRKVFETCREEFELFGYEP